VWEAVYRPFGEVVSITGSAALNLRFPGQYFLIENGLAYNWHRHYDASLGRYTQPDPLGVRTSLSALSRSSTRLPLSSAATAPFVPSLRTDPLEFSDGPSLYAYARSSPTMNTDATGEFLIYGFIISAGVNVAAQIAVNLAANGGQFGLALKCVDISDVFFSGLIGTTGLGLGSLALGKISISQYAVGSAVGSYLKLFYPSVPIRVGNDCECSGVSGLGNAIKNVAQ
jgi:RHS repeat-associated protein